MLKHSLLHRCLANQVINKKALNLAAAVLAAVALREAIEKVTIGWYVSSLYAHQRTERTSERYNRRCHRILRLVNAQHPQSVQLADNNSDYTQKLLNICCSEEKILK